MVKAWAVALQDIDYAEAMWTLPELAREYRHITVADIVERCHRKRTPNNLLRKIGKPIYLGGGDENT